MTDKLNLFINWRPCQSHGCCTQSEGRFRHVSKETRVGCSFEFQNSREGCPWGPIGCQRSVCVLFQSTTVIHNNSCVLLSCLPLIHNQAKIPRGVIPSDSMTFMMDLKCKREQCDDFNWCRYELGTFNLPKVRQDIWNIAFWCLLSACKCEWYFTLFLKILNNKGFINWKKTLFKWC